MTSFKYPKPCKYLGATSCEENSLTRFSVFLFIEASRDTSNHNSKFIMHSAAIQCSRVSTLAAGAGSAADEAGPSRRDHASPEARVDADSPPPPSRPPASRLVMEQLERAARGVSPAEPRELPDASHPPSPPREFLAIFKKKDSGLSAK